MSVTSSLHSLFPVPVLHLQGLLDGGLASRLAEKVSQRTLSRNPRSPALQHTGLIAPGEDADIDAVASALLPQLASFGMHLMGEPLRWGIKELWCNVLDEGGHQSLHNHANSFISGVVYLTATAGCTQTTFSRQIGNPEFKLVNEHEGTRSGPFNSQRWMAPDAAPGDALLFPSHLLHEVPPNQGARRVTLSFNAIPDRLNSWGYRLALGS